MGNTRNPRHHLFNKIREYYKDFEPGNVHQVLDRNRCNLMYSVIRKRVNVLGWKIHDALTKPHADVVPVKSGGLRTTRNREQENDLPRIKNVKRARRVPRVDTSKGANWYLTKRFAPVQHEDLR